MCDRRQQAFGNLGFISFQFLVLDYASPEKDGVQLCQLSYLQYGNFETFLFSFQGILIQG